MVGKSEPGTKFLHVLLAPDSSCLGIVPFMPDSFYILHMLWSGWHPQCVLLDACFFLLASGNVMATSSNAPSIVVHAQMMGKSGVNSENHPTICLEEKPPAPPKTD